MLAYHSDPALKERILAQLAQHRAADEIVKGQYWQGGKGCAVGCTIHSGNHAEYELRFGIPQALAFLEDRIFEGLPNADAKLWPERFMGAIRPGADLSRVHLQFLHWLLTVELSPVLAAHPEIRPVVLRCASVLEAPMRGEPFDQHEAVSAAEASADAARAAEASWAAAARAAEAAEAAKEASAAARAAAAEAAKEAADAARAAAARAAEASWAAAARAAEASWAAADAARAAAAWAAEAAAASYQRQADKLIALLEAAWPLSIPATPAPPWRPPMQSDLAAQCRIDLDNPHPKGGQHAGFQRLDMIVTHEPTGIVVKIPGDYTRSQHKQRELALSAIEWIIAND